MSDTIKAYIYLEFIENHLPALKAGKYTVSGKQDISGKGIKSSDGNSNTFTLHLPSFQVKVEGERFSLKPGEVVSKFPPSKSLGHYAHVLPHIALKRDTLPWERMLADPEEDEDEELIDKAPWLALLVLNPEDVMTDQGKEPDSVKAQKEAEHGYTKTVKQLKKELDDLKAKNDDKINNWPPELEDEKAEEPIRVVYVKKDILARLVPKAKELTWLSHARKSRIGFEGLSDDARKVKIKDAKGKLLHEETIDPKDGKASIHCGKLTPGDYTITVDDKAVEPETFTVKGEDQIGNESAIVVASRLPEEGKKSIIHLISLEKRFKKDGDAYILDTDGFHEMIPVVSLHSWNFTALSEKETFRHILLHLNHEFLFGMNVGEMEAEPDLDHLRPGFVSGKYRLSDDAKVQDRAKKTLRDKDHCFYFGGKGAIYNAAGRKIGDENGSVPDSEEAALDRLKEYKLHKNSVSFADCDSRQVWVEDGNKHYFASEDPVSKRILVFALPTDTTPSLRMPSREGEGDSLDKANHFLQQGYVPLTHSFRRGDHSISWYRSPMLPGKQEKQIPEEQFPVHTADELLRYEANYGMFDASYAAAWELGRLMCLHNKRISLALYRWKRTHVQLLKTMEQQHLHPHLPYRANTPGKIVLPEKVEKWISDLSLLKGVPFSYLVPDSKMLPPESLRFFYLDPSWIASLVDGALSIGRVNQTHDTIVHKQSLLDTAKVNLAKPITGILLRSSVVKGWPNLQVKAYHNPFGDGPTTTKNEDISDRDSELTCLRMERLTDNLLLCLFEGEVTVLDIHEKPETIHFGFVADKSEESNQQYVKYPVMADGSEGDIKIKSATEGDEDFYDEDHRSIRAEVLARMIGENKGKLGYESFSAAQFALSLTEGVARVRFIAGVNS